MAAVTAAAIGAVGAIGGAAMANRGAKDAARAQQDAANAGIAEQQAAREQYQQNIAPYLQFGQQGISGLQGLLADPDSIKDSAAYQWRFNQGLQGLDRSAAARGGLFGGGADADRIAFGQGLASQEYGDQWSRLANIAGMGQNAAAGAGSMGQASANAIGNLYGNIGQAQAGQAINQANTWGNALAGLGNIAGNYMEARKSSYQQPQTNFGAFTPSGGLGANGANNSLIWGNFAGLNGWRG